MKRLSANAGCVTFLGMLLNAPASAYLISSFGPSAYNTDTTVMDSTLGISGFTIEDFEDGVLAAGLTISFAGDFSGPNGSPAGPIAANPPRIIDANGAWDGVASLQNFPDSPFRTRTIFNLAGGVSSFGIGFSDFALDYQLYINDQLLIDQLSTLSGVVIPAANRNGYLRVDVESGDLAINTVEFRQRIVSGSIDAVKFDRVAFNQGVSVPEPTTLAMFGLGLAGLGWSRRKRA